MTYLNDFETLNSPTYFAKAAEALVGSHTGPLTPHHVAQTLSHLARQGLIVSAAEHQRMCDAYAAQLMRMERIADDLIARASSGDFEWVEGR